MLICGHLNIFPNTFCGDGIWYFKYQIPNTFCIFNFNIIIMTKHNKWTCNRTSWQQRLTYLLSQPYLKPQSFRGVAHQTFHSVSTSQLNALKQTSSYVVSINSISLGPILPGNEWWPWFVYFLSRICCTKTLV